MIWKTGMRFRLKNVDGMPLLFPEMVGKEGTFVSHEPEPDWILCEFCDCTVKLDCDPTYLFPCHTPNLEPIIDDKTQQFLEKLKSLPAFKEDKIKELA